MGQSADPRRGADVHSHLVREAPVDLVHLARHTLGDADLEREVLQLFVTQSTIYLNRLKEADSGEQWRRAAHTIKGSARGIGAWSVAECAETAEKLMLGTEDDRCRVAVVDLEREVTAVNTYIRSLFVDH